MLNDYKKRKIEKVFDFYDANQNGVVEMSDIDEISESLAAELKWPPEGIEVGELRAVLRTHWTRLIELADVNDDKKVSREEFMDFFNVAVSNDTNFYRHLKPFFDGIFYALDQDNDGLLSKKDYIAFYRGFRNSQEHAEMAFKALDKNNDGTISHLELYNAFYQFHMSESVDKDSELFYGPLK